MLQQIERRRVEPLQIVEEQGQRMFRAGEDANKTLENELKPALRLPRLELRDRRLLADDELQLGDQVGHEPSIRLQRLQKRATPGLQFGVALGK